MAKSTKGNMLIGQSGGPTVVINQSLVGAVMAAQKSPKIGKIYGAVHGIQGILNQDLMDLTREPVANLKTVGLTPSSALGSVRKKPTEADCQNVFKVCQAHDIKYFFYIGGNDSAETAHIIHEVAKANDYDLHVFHIPKTVDNDLRGTDHSPGFGSAAKFVAQAFMGDDLDNRSLKGIKINIIMGRHAGFLTAASALGRADKDSGPHLIYLPEVPFSEAQFVRDVKAVYKRLGRCIVAVSEGIADKKGQAIATKFVTEVDSHGNVQLSGSGALGDFLAGLVKDKMPKGTRVRADTFGYLQRSFCGIYSKVDAKEALQAGMEAVKHATKGAGSGTISFIRAKGKDYKISYKLSPLSVVAKETTHVAPKFINKAGNNVTKAFIDYAKPLAGDLPPVGFLNGKRVAKKKI